LADKPPKETKTHPNYRKRNKLHWLWSSRWAKKWCWQRDHDILFITFFLGQGNVATWASRPPLGRSPWVVVIKNLKYGFDYCSLKVMSSWALLPFRGFSVTYMLRTHKCAPASQQFFQLTVLKILPVTNTWIDCRVS
jgi:hypothetical protein